MVLAELGVELEELVRRKNTIAFPVEVPGKSSLGSLSPLPSPDRSRGRDLL